MSAMARSQCAMFEKTSRGTSAPGISVGHRRLQRGRSGIAAIVWRAAVTMLGMCRASGSPWSSGSGPIGPMTKMRISGGLRSGNALSNNIAGMAGRGWDESRHKIECAPD